jgi:hypothetical protein
MIYDLLADRLVPRNPKGKVGSLGEGWRFKIPYLFIGLLVYWFIGLFFNLPITSGQTMSGENYIMQVEDIDTSPEIIQESESKIDTNTETPDPVAPSIPFSASLSLKTIDFGTLNPTNPVIRTADLTINSSQTYGYTVFVSENQSLATSSPDNKIYVPDTTCDNGTCDTENAAEWINTLTYGFGYRCDNIIGNDCNADFSSLNYYKHFPNIQNNDSLQPIMASEASPWLNIKSSDKKIRISYKVNISRTQDEEAYTNTVTYIAVPNY